ncbi:MAG: hypothetical protein ILA24_01640 [Ruminococcus sp.]|nr:hypothetical protein [Ruminococcus sp.]
MIFSKGVRKKAQKALVAFASAAMLTVFAGAQLPANKAFAADPQPQPKSYTLNAKLIDGDAMPGVYSVKAVKGDSITNGKTIGIPSVSKQALANSATKEMPAIIMGAAVNYEKRTGPVDFEPFSKGTERIAPYSYFKHNVIDEQMQNEYGTVTTHKKLSGFDGSYYIVRVDVSDIIKGHGDGEYLHVKQESNKALMVAAGMNGTTYCDALGNKTGSYSLAENAKALKDSGANDVDKQTPYFDVIVMSSGKLAAGADAGKQDAPSADIKLSFYVDDKMQYNDLKELDKNNPPTFPYTVGGVTYKLEADYTKALLAKFYDDAAAAKADTATSYTVMDSDLEIDVAIDKNEADKAQDRSQGIKWIEEKPDFWSMNKSIAHQPYDNHTILLICEVPVLEGLEITSTTGKERSVILDVNSFDIQIANNSDKNKAGLTINSNSKLRLMDSSNTSGAELAIGNNATKVIKKGGSMIIDETCTNEVEYDAATAVDPAQADTTIMNGAITIEGGGHMINYGVINIEGTEGKPQQPSSQEQQAGQQVHYDKKSADLFVNPGGKLDNYGCISLKGVMYMLGTLNNYGRYNDTIVAYDPDKGSTTYHKGIQITWKDIVTDPGVQPGRLALGIDENDKIFSEAVLNNYGDIVLVPGTIDNYGTLNNLNGADGISHLYMCTAKEAIIPITPTKENPLVVEKRVTLDPPKKSVFNNKGTFNDLKGATLKAKVALIHNGVLGELTVLDEAAVTSPASKTLEVTGKPQQLISLAAVKGGTMFYALSKGAVDESKLVWSTSIPCATEEGEYTVWFYAQGDDDHNDSKIGQVNVTIAKKASDTVPADNSKPTEGSDVDNASNKNTPAKGDVVPPNTGYNGTTTVTFFLLGAAALLAAATVYTKKKSK